MKFWEEKGIWWPDCENRKDYEHAFGRIDAIDAALALCKGRMACIQAGGWVGLWPRRLAKEFEYVFTYEPVPYLYECLRKNTADLQNVTAADVALGAHDGALNLTVALSGCTSAVPEDSAKYRSRVIEQRMVPMITIDGDFMNCESIDAIFLDVERFEIDVLKGAKETIKRFSPVITVEVLKGENAKMEEFMSGIGYSLKARAHNDWIYTR